jgi:sugar phosphate isomerase/epimerase
VLPCSVDQIGLPGTSFGEDVELLRRLGVPAIAVLRGKLPPGGAREARMIVDDSGLEVSLLLSAGAFTLENPSSWPAQLDDYRAALDEAATIGAQHLLLTSGPAGQLSYEEAEARFVELLETVLEEAEQAGVVLAFEPNNALRVDLGYIHTLHDALDLADEIDSPTFRVLAEVNNCWIERHLYDNIARRVSRIGLVQISDFAEGTLSTPHRVPLGDGIIPLPRILDAFVQAGYPGYFDIEVLGPVVDAMGGEESTRRSLEYLESLAI